MINIVCHDCKARTPDAVLVKNNGPLKLICVPCSNTQRLGAEVFINYKFDRFIPPQKHQISKKLAKALGID